MVSLEVFVASSCAACALAELFTESAVYVSNGGGSSAQRFKREFVESSSPAGELITPAQTLDRMEAQSLDSGRVSKLHNGVLELHVLMTSCHVRLDSSTEILEILFGQSCMRMAG